VERDSPVNGEENFDDDDYQAQPRKKSSPPVSARKSRSVTKIIIKSTVKSNSTVRESEGFFGKFQSFMAGLKTSKEPTEAELKALQLSENLKNPKSFVLRDFNLFETWEYILSMANH
jgi:hypothetical protein